MAKTKSKERAIYTIEEFDKIYLPNRRDEVEIPSRNKVTEFGVDLTKKIMRRVDLER